MLPLFAAALLLQASTPSPNPELARAATNPYALARYVDSHLGFDWNVVWQALGTQGAFIQPCGKLTDGRSQCSTELITVLDPDQEILLVQGDLTPADVYIRFLKQDNGTWKFSGVAQAFIHNHPRRHEVNRSMGTPLLRISSQGVRGSDIDSEVETWYDLTRTTFDPVFSFPIESYQHDWSSGIKISTSAVLIPQEDSIDVVLNVRLGANYDLGAINLSAVYRRPAPGSPYKIQVAYAGLLRKTPIPVSEFEEFTDQPAVPPIEALVRYNFEGFKQLAQRKDTDAKTWLKELLSHCEDTPEVLKLKAILP